MIVGWAANDIREASEVITHLKQHCEYEGFNRDAVEQFLRSQRREIWNGSELAGFILSPQGTLTTFRSANCLEIETPTLDRSHYWEPAAIHFNSISAAILLRLSVLTTQKTLQYEQ